MLYTKEALEPFKHMLKDDVYNKLLFFFETPASTKSYCVVGRDYVEKQLKPMETLDYVYYQKLQQNSFYYSSDQIPYYARLSQPCLGPLGGLAPEQTNLYIWMPGINLVSDANKPISPFYTYFKELVGGMFKDGVEFEDQEKFISKYGYMLTPSVLNLWPSPVVVGFFMAIRYGFKFKHDNLMDAYVEGFCPSKYFESKVLNSTLCIQGVLAASNWANVWNIFNSEFNPSIMKLKPYSVDPDYSCWDSPILNLFTDHDVVGQGKYITRRAMDIYWDSWVVRNHSDTAYYGRNNGATYPKNNGEVGKDLKKHLGSKFSKMTYAEADAKIRELILEKVNEYGASRTKVKQAA